MSTDTVTKTQKQAIERATKLFETYADLQRQKATIEASMKAAKVDLTEFAKRHRKQFDDNGQFHFPGFGYLKWGTKSIITKLEGFSFKKFVAKYPIYVQETFKLSPIKNAFTDADLRKKFQEEAKIDMELIDELKIEVRR